MFVIGNNKSHCRWTLTSTGWSTLHGMVRYWLDISVPRESFIALKTKGTVPFQVIE